MICLLAAFIIFNFASQIFEAKADEVAKEMTPVYVCEGDTLWSIVEENYDYTGDIRAAIHGVKRINHMTGSELTVGEVIYVPVR